LLARVAFGSIMASQAKSSGPGKSEFSIDEFMGEIEKAEAETTRRW
jgi:hypothetical protein